ncbi:lipopolysaccharide-induced tumor necrosis factor-alpha factor homolog [Electrophorus electricus]|uniref:lipopolysaccharide-induced tumor necrosis factor-alpha factor homolog n=1 Tax=Electrophorus electricus TaxID=8005 RepID=UPI0015D08804|nr:lipopolysaccharide-induced tumor necrosis factor-alpha factor homolog [Electrophorus electricus]XP_026858553.2 lipopolysaccharide-induced tumor necrosis factor-alpha factor homolog [Electrophorus electricus]
MSSGAKDPPPYIVPVDEKGDSVKVYKVHTPFNPANSNDDQFQLRTHNSSVQVSSADNAKNKYVSYDTQLGRSPAMATCTDCREQVLTQVTYKVGAYAWLMCLLFICCGFILGCCLIPFFVKFFKDAYHTCPKCGRIIHVDKKRCC